MADVAKELLKEIEHFVGLQELVFNADGFCKLEFQDQFLFMVHRNDILQRLVITAEFATPTTLSSELFASILSFNALRVAAPGAWIALDEETGTLFLADDYTLTSIESEAWKARLLLFFKNYFACQGFLDRTTQDPAPENLDHEVLPPDWASLA